MQRYIELSSRSHLLLLATLVLSSPLAACDGDDGDTAGDSTEGETTEQGEEETDGTEETTGDTGDVGFGEVNATIEYAGEAEGLVILAAFPECPPVAQPVAFVPAMVESWPHMATLGQVPVGDVCIFAYIDVEPQSLTGPGEEDPFGFVDMVTVSSTEPAEVSVTIEDPA